MNKCNIIDGNIGVRLINLDDTELYYKLGFEESSDEAKYYTGTVQVL